VTASTFPKLQRYLSVAPEMAQQLDLLRRTVEENERALDEARARAAAAGGVDFGVVEAEAIAQLRQARLEIRRQTRVVQAFAERLPRAS